MLKIMGFLTKREDMETRAFIEYYETRHVPLIRSLAPTPIGYKRNYLVRGDDINIEDDTIDFDDVTELIFPDRAAYLAWGKQLSASSRGEPVVSEDEARFLDRTRTRAYVVEEHETPN
jgi:EthD domain-containing protein